MGKAVLEGDASALQETWLHLLNSSMMQLQLAIDVTTHIRIRLIAFGMDQIHPSLHQNFKVYLAPDHVVSWLLSISKL